LCVSEKVPRWCFPNFPDYGTLLSQDTYYYLPEHLCSTDPSLEEEKSQEMQKFRKMAVNAIPTLDSTRLAVFWLLFNDSL